MAPPPLPQQVHARQTTTHDYYREDIDAAAAAQQQQQPPYPHAFYHRQPYFEQRRPRSDHGRRRRIPHLRLRRSSYIFLTARNFALIIPGLILILNIWWSVTQRVCPSDADTGDSCFWTLWLSLPIATVSFIWGILTNISARRARHGMVHIPLAVEVAFEFLLALGYTVCFAMSIYHSQRPDTWSESSQGGMAALLGLLMIVHLIMFACKGQELVVQRHRSDNINQIPM